MYLSVLSGWEWIYKFVAVVLMFCNIVSQPDYRHFVEFFGLTVCLQAISCSRDAFDTKEAALWC